MGTRLRRTIASLVAILAVGAGVAAGTAGATAPKPKPKPPAPIALDWADCGDGFECATARVPRDYDDPSAGTMALSVIRKPATGPGKRLGSVFTNPGGPGGSGSTSCAARRRSSPA